MSGKLKVVIGLLIVTAVAYVLLAEDRDPIEINIESDKVEA